MEVKELIDSINESIAQEIGWKYLKSKRCIKKTLGKLEFKINCYSSKWNRKDEGVEVNWEFCLWTKEYDKTVNINSVVCRYSIQNGKEYWYDITTQEKRREVFEIVIEEIKKTAAFLYEQFEQDYRSAVRLLLKEEYFDKFHVQLDFLADNLGIDAVREIARKEYEKCPELIKQEVERYRNGENISTTWTLNRCNLRYIVQNNLLGSS